MSLSGPGPGLGFLVAAQVGPIWLLCARSVLRGRLVTGLAIGAGAALVDLAYACLGVAGAAQLLRVTGLRLALGLVGTAVLVALGGRTLWSAFRVRAGGETQAELASPWRALRVSLAATASNPLTIASWAAVFAAASAASVATRARLPRGTFWKSGLAGTGYSPPKPRNVPDPSVALPRTRCSPEQLTSSLAAADGADGNERRPSTTPPCSLTARSSRSHPLDG